MTKTTATTKAATALAASATKTTGGAEVIVKPQAEVKVEVKTETKGGAETITVAVPKTQIANAIFKDMFAAKDVPARKDMIKAAMDAANISKDCAATYLQNFKRKNGLQKNSAPAAEKA